MLRDDALTVVPESAGGGKESFAVIKRSFNLVSAIVNRRHVAKAGYHFSFSVNGDIVSFDGFSNILLWHPHGSKMLCIEPWQCLPSYADEIKEFKERKGVVTLSPNREITFTRKITY